MLDTQAFSVSLHFIQSHFEALPTGLLSKPYETRSIFWNKVTTPNKFAKKKVLQKIQFTASEILYTVYENMKHPTTVEVK
jgi:hypothetical protein